MPHLYFFLQLRASQDQENIGSFLFLVDPRAELNARLLQGHSSITIDIPTPAPEEIEVALARVLLQHDITMRHTNSIANYLSANGNLQSALRRIAWLISRRNIPAP